MGGAIYQKANEWWYSNVKTDGYCGNISSYLWMLIPQERPTAKSNFEQSCKILKEKWTFNPLNGQHNFLFKTKLINACFSLDKNPILDVDGEKYSLLADFVSSSSVPEMDNNM